MASMQNGLVKAGDAGIPSTWETLFTSALTVLDEIARHGRANPFWTFGGGTVLMLRYGHRFSKDIDIFVPDPQSLGFVTPRLSEVAESITIAKKMWHRGDHITGRDIFDFALIAEREPVALMAAREWMVRHANAVFRQVVERYTPLKKQFEAIDTLNYHPTFDQACEALKANLTAMLEVPPLQRDDEPDLGST